MINNEQLEVITNIASDNIDTVLSSLDINFTKTKKMYVGRCPVHGGDNYSAWNLYPDGDQVKCVWKCRTHQCHKKYKPTIFGLVRGVHEYNTNKIMTFQESVNYLCKLLKINIKNIKVDPKDRDKKSFYKQVSEISKKIEKKPLTINRKQVRDSLVIPASYYLDRGYDKDILDRYDIGLCDKPNKNMFNRIVVPMYDENYNFFIGCTGRSIFNKCSKCGYHHNGGCPKTNLERYKSEKWINNTDFPRDSCLYNYWFSKKFIKESGTVIIVEGPGDVWKLEQAGISNSVAKLGTFLSEDQLIILECSGALNIIDLSDNDEAGQKSKAFMKERCSRLYNLHFPEYNYKDIGEMTVEQITNELKPRLQI